MSRKAIAMKSLKEKWLSIVQSAEEKGEKGIGGSSTVTVSKYLHLVICCDDTMVPLTRLVVLVYHLIVLISHLVVLLFHLVVPLFHTMYVHTMNSTVKCS